MHGRVAAVCVGPQADHEWLGRVVRTAIFKHPVEGRVALRGVNLAGDDQADRVNHGGPDKAVYAYAAEDTAWWEGQLGRPLGPGAFGENLHTGGVAASAAVIGERWHVGGAVLEVCQPRIPCFKLGLRMGDPRFPPRFGVAGRPGAYLRVVQEGDIGAGDPITVAERPAHGVTTGMVSAAYFGRRELAPRLLEAPALSPNWVTWAETVLARDTGMATKRQ
jgi:MOSC domain-containing protein YiiM